MEKENESNYDIIVQRLNPHFSFNALATIAYLCRKDPQAASQATMDFSEYFRHSLESLVDEPIIPFSKEFDHIRSFIEIEKLRFKGKINFIHEIEENDFSIPAVTILPFIDNAVRHGILSRKEGGTVTLLTWSEENCHVILIIDDGIGFSTSDINYCGMNGIPYAKRRLETINATIEIESVINEGTTVTVRIPK